MESLSWVHTPFSSGHDHSPIIWIDLALFWLCTNCCKTFADVRRCTVSLSASTGMTQSGYLLSFTAFGCRSKNLLPSEKKRKEEDGMLPSSQNNWACLQILLISTFDHNQLTPRISAQRLVVHHHAPPDIDIATDISWDDLMPFPPARKGTEDRGKFVTPDPREEPCGSSTAPRKWRLG